MLKKFIDAKKYVATTKKKSAASKISLNSVVRPNTYVRFEFMKMVNEELSEIWQQKIQKCQ